MTIEKASERSIDTLQRIYAVIVALAINEAVKRTFLQNGSGVLEVDYCRIPEFVAFIFTAVPFVHGINRHLDKTLKTSREENRGSLIVVLVFDFLIFLAESCVLFLLAASVRSELFFFQLLMLLLTLDLLWSVVTWPITKSVVWQWIVVNILAVVAGIAVIYWFDKVAVIQKLWILMIIAVARTCLDYFLAWNFYFPSEPVI